ncbi:DUF983 domain-containing protein [Psychroserpens luteolus]|uniref:DUF983 domain-containing protein n=1 Tax=Psychroserpens luteolus TaxID=2855840 RepID=UPI001E4A6D18|nr:DUF983 domain-containing protein [Psychroserpens luteolus]MCD2260219.1 DUF983 domain-containing protein [Psychroserpens luteolus]
MLKGTKIYSIFTGSCPKCHNESMYQRKNPYILNDVLKINDNCSHCGMKYRLEPSFFYGSMYVSYGVGIAFAVAAFLISYLFLETTLFTAFLAIVGTLIILGPIIMRLSRNIWINLFVSYDKKATKNS